MHHSLIGAENITLQGSIWIMGWAIYIGISHQAIVGGVKRLQGILNRPITTISGPFE